MAVALPASARGRTIESARTVSVNGLYLYLRASRAAGRAAQKLGRGSTTLRFVGRGLDPEFKDAGIPSSSARVSATLSRKDSSLYDAMRAIIGAELRSKLDVPKAMPSYLDDLLKELDDRLGSDQVDGSAHRQRPTNR